MMKKKIPVCSCLFVYIILISSCSNYSLFTGWDAPDTERISRYTGSKLLLALEKNSGSTVFYNTMTDAQADRIKQSLDGMIRSQDETASVKLRASEAAVDLLVHTDALVYAVIYNLADPFLEAITGKNTNVKDVFKFFMEPLQSKVKNGTEMRDALSLFFLHLYQIAVYYDPVLINTARSGIFSGSDLQKYLVAAIVGSIVASTWQLMQGILEDVEAVVFASIAYIYEHVADLQSLEGILNELKVWIQSQQASMNTVSFAEAPVFSDDIFTTYGEQLKINAKVLSLIAKNAGYETIGNTVADILNDF